MPFNSHLLNYSVIPHLFSKLDAETKSAYRERYKNVKRTAVFGSMGTVTAIEGFELCKDIFNSKLKAYGYKSLFVVALGPFLQIVSLPIYVFTYGMRIRKIAVMISDVGAKISRGEMGIANWMFIASDLILFGEPVEIVDNSTGMIYRNETSSQLSTFLDTLGGNDG